MAGANGLEINEIGNDVILAAARAAAKEAGEEVPPERGEEASKIAVDPKEVASGKEGEEGKGGEGKQETDDEKAAREKAEAEAEVYIPEEPKPKETPKVEPKEPIKAEEKADADEVDAFAKELKDDGFDDDTIKMMRKAVKLGGDLALKQMQAAQTQKEAEVSKADAESAAERAEYRRKEFVAVGTLQKDGRIPKVPVDTQKKLAEGKTLTEEEVKHPGVQRQFAVWNHMAAENQAAVERGEAPYLTTFRAALSSLEAQEVRTGKADKLKAENEQRHKVAPKLAVGTAGGDGAAKKPAYVKGQSLDDVAQEIINEYRAT